MCIYVCVHVYIERLIQYLLIRAAKTTNQCTWRWALNLRIATQ